MSVPRLCAITLFFALTTGTSLVSAQTQDQDFSPPALAGQAEGNFIIKDFHFRSGEVLPEVRVHYVTLGKPHRNASGEIDNAVLLLHSTSNDTAEFLDRRFSGPLFGPGQPFDLTTFYLIIPDAIGHGKSSKPSNGLRAHFPHYGYEDMVVAQYRLVTEKLGVTHIFSPNNLAPSPKPAFVWQQPLGNKKQRAAP
jgi:homoserine O-acetyltransferase/O-succinyltransferase